MRRLLLALTCCAALLTGAAPVRAEVVDDEPAVAARGAGDARAVIRGSDGVLWARSWDGAAWSSWTSLGGGQLTSGPSISARPDGIYDVVARGPDNSVYYRYFTPSGGWVPWTSLGGSFLSAPSVSYRQGTGQIDIVGVGTDHQPYLKSYEPSVGGWSGWGALGGTASGRPSVISAGPQTLEIYIRGTDGQLYEKYWNATSGFSEWLALGGGLSSGVSATAWDTNRRDVFARATDGALWVRSWTNPGGWTQWARIGGGPGSGPGATALGPNQLLVFVRDHRRVTYNGFVSAWSGWKDFGYAPTFSDPPPPVVAGPTGSTLRLRAGIGCVPRGGRVPVSVTIRQRAGRPKPRVIKVVFSIDRGKHKRVDRRKPYRTRIRVTFKRGSTHRVRARISYRRKGSSRIRHTTVSKRFAICK